MSGTLIHLAVADKIYDISGSSIVKNLPLFFGGNIAPDAVHAKEDYQRRDKKHSHLCDDIYSYGYGYPEMKKLFRHRVNKFAENYYQSADKDKDLYLGYIIHLLVDEFDMYSAFERLIAQLGESKINFDKPSSRKRLADEVNYGSYRDFFVEDASGYDISAREYRFTQNVVDMLFVKTYRNEPAFQSFIKAYGSSPTLGMLIMQQPVAQLLLYSNFRTAVMTLFHHTQFFF